MMFQSILNDRFSGSSVLLEKTLDWLSYEVALGNAIPDAAFHQLREVHSGMACFVNLQRFFSENELSEKSLNKFRMRIAKEEYVMLESFCSSFPEDIDRVAVYSCSGMVLKALTMLKRSLEVDVALCAPDGEGQSMAESLAKIPCVISFLWADGPYFSHVPETRAVVLGCDAISPSWLINRSGTGAVVALAAESGIPVYLVPGPLKSLTDDELLELSLKQGIDVPTLVTSPDIRWGNPLLEVVGIGDVIVPSIDCL
jgi:translation initiation factor 2B subunit (eIF-2B alpha/beta/delta family)